MAASIISSASPTLRINQTYVKPQVLHQRFIIVPFPKCKHFSVATSLQVGGVILDSTHPQRSDTCSSGNSMEELERQLEDLFLQVKTMIATGNQDCAVDLLRANYEAVVESGARGIEEAALLDVLALGYIALGDTDAVVPLMHMLKGIVDGVKDEELLLDSILMHMGSIYEKLEKFEASVCVYRRSLKIMEVKYGSKSLLLCTPLMGLAKVLDVSGKASKAIETYRQVITLLESSKEGSGESLVLPLSALGDLLMKEGKASDAEYVFSRVLDIYMRSCDGQDGKVAMAMCSLAKAKCAKGSANEAIDLYKSAITIVEDSKHMALDDKAVEMMRIDLAELLHVVGRGEEGRALLEKCLLISERSKGKDHPSLVPHLVNLATSYSRSKNFAEAERLLMISLQIMSKTTPPDDPSITFPMLQLAVTLYSLHRDKEAERLALNVLHIREKAFGKESLPVGEALDCLVSIQSRLEKDDSELVELLERVLKIQETAFGSESEEVIETLKKILHYLDKQGMKNEKTPLQKRLSVLRNKRKQKIM